MIDLDHSWTDTFSAMGHWWTAENPEIQIPGTLDYANGQIRLTLLGSFEPDHFMRNNEPTSLSIINGRASGQLFTLLQCHEIQGVNHSESANQSTVEAKQLLVGAIFPKEELLQFTSCAVRFHGLENWVWDSPVDRSLGESGERSFSHQYNLPSDREFRFGDDDVKLILSYACSRRLSGFDDSFVYRNQFSLNTATPKSVAWFVEQFDTLRSLIMFLMGSQTALSHFFMEVPRTLNDLDDIPRRCRFYFRHKPFEKELNLGVMEMRYCMPMMVDRFQGILNSWLARNDQIKTAAALVQGALLNKDLDVRFQFLNMIHALECFHRSVGNRQYMTEDEYKPIRCKIAAAIPRDIGEGHWNSLKNKIKYGYEISLRSRLHKMLEELSDPIKSLVCVDAKKFGNQIAETRNYFSHYTDELREKAVLDTKRLYWLSRRMAVWGTSLLLQTLGLTPDEIHAGLERCPELRWVVSRRPEV